MAVVKVYNLKKQEVGEMNLPDDVFKTEVNAALVHQVVVAQLAGRRRGTASTKTKAEVRGGGRKPFRQKGTGNARQGSTRSPLMPGGGESFGPKPRSYFKQVPKGMATGAMRSALSDKFSCERLLVIDEMKFAKPSTKVFAETLGETFGIKKALIVDHDNKNAELSARNLATHKYLRTEGVNVYDVVNYDWLVISKKAAQSLAQKLAGGKAKAKAKE